MELPDIVKEESGCSFYCDHCVCQNKVYLLEDGIHDGHNGVMSRGLWEFNHKINTERIPLCIWNRQRLKLANWRVSSRFSPEAEITGTYILADIPRHLRLPVVLGHQFQCLPASGVSCDVGVVAKGYNLSA